MNKRLVDHYKFSFCKTQQIGFRTGHRASDSLIVLKTLISKYMYIVQRKTIFSCFVDLRKAFDSLWHSGLLYKLAIDGVGRKFYNVVQNMYNSCESSIKIDNKYLEYFTLERGVKQGDSLSPTLFNCFINDLHEIFDNSCNQLELEKSFISSLSFADDLIIFFRNSSGIANCIK